MAQVQIAVVTRMVLTVRAVMLTARLKVLLLEGDPGSQWITNALQIARLFEDLLNKRMTDLELNTAVREIRFDNPELSELGLGQNSLLGILTWREWGVSS